MWINWPKNIKEEIYFILLEFEGSCTFSSLKVLIKIGNSCNTRLFIPDTHPLVVFFVFIHSVSISNVATSKTN